MNIATSFQSAGRTGNGIVLSIGNFDGLHRAHARILAWTVRTAKRMKAEAWALTFSNHPAEILKGRKPTLLSPLDEKLDLLSGTGLDGVLLLRFTPKLSRMSAEDFLGLLCRKMRIRAVCVGRNFLFGSSNRGTPGLLRKWSGQRGFGLKVFPVLKDRQTGKIVSSTAIRTLIAEGKVDTAAKLLGRPYSLSAGIVPGRKLGRTIGYPTINFDPAGLTRKLVPLDGVYITETTLSGSRGSRRGLTYIGPVLGTGRRTIETHLLDYKGSDRGTATVRFLKFVRRPRNIRTPEDLRKRIRRDIILSRRL